MRLHNTLLLFLQFALFTLWLNTSAVAASSSVIEVHFSEFSQREGLSDGTITDIIEDSDGFIWISTVNGLNRYSGYEMVQYHPSDLDANSLPSGFIRTSFKASDGSLWFGTMGGLAKYQPKSDDFVIFDAANSALKDDNIWAISEDHDGNLIVADTSNVYHLNTTTSDITPFSTQVNFPREVKVIRDEPHRTWLGTFDTGVYLLDKKSNSLYSLKDVNPWGLNLDITSLFDLKVINGEYWLATLQGVIILQNDGTVSYRIDHDSHPNLPKGRVRTLSHNGSLVWIGTEEGLSVFDTKTRELFTLDASNSRVTGLNQSYILDVAHDSHNTIWVGTYEGLYRYHPKASSLRLYDVENYNEGQSDANTIWAFAEGRDDNIWFATQNQGLGRFNTLSGITEYYLTRFEPTVWDIEIDSNGFFWLATSNGLSVFEYVNNKVKLVSTLFENSFVDTLYFDGEKIWLSPDPQTLIAVDVDVFKQTLLNSSSASNDAVTEYRSDIASTGILPLMTDSNGLVWLSLESGIELFDPQRGVFASTTIDLESRAINVYEWNDYYWVTTQSQEIIKLDKSDLKVIQTSSFNSDGGLLLSATGVGNQIWLVDNKGIQQIYLPEMKKGIAISAAQMSYNSLNQQAALTTSEGWLIFGGDRGFHFFSPENFEEQSNERLSLTSPPLLQQLKLFGRPVDFALADQIIDKPFRLVEGIELKSTDTRFSFSYELINPVNPSTVEYRYRLAGLDKAWTISEQERVAHYNNVPFGSYVFEVQAKETHKDWSPSTKLNVHVMAPAYLQSSALIAYTVIVTMILIYFVRQYQIRKGNQKTIKESEERLKLTLWSSGDELWDWDIYSGQVIRSNTWGTLDFPQDNIRTTSAYDANIHPNDLPRVQQALKEHLDGRSEFFEQTYRTRTFNNKWIWILDRGKIVTRDHNNQPQRMTGTLKNIHHLKEAEEQLNLFKRSIENISEGVFITDTKFRFISVNTAYCRYTGETRDQALASYMYFHQYPDAFTQEVKKVLRSKGNWSGEVESTRVNSEKYEMELNIDAVHDDDGTISHYVGVFSDITTRKNTEKELLKLANTDPLTELPNRSFYQASHNNLVRKDTPHTLLCLDMDNFKKINDSLGHQTGDILIKQIAKRIQRITGNNATCYRLGGDEFSVLIEERSDIHSITHFTQNLLDTLARPFIINKQEFVLGASIGIAFFPDDGSSPQEMLKNADTAMYFAKNSGGNGYKFFSGEMNQNAVRQLQIENLIRQGIKDDLFTVYYQPKIDITTGKLVSMEALVRFEHPQKGIVSPGQFIPLAEQTGQIIDIGDIVLRKACEDTKRWVSKGLFTGRVAVNISAKQFQLPNLVDRIEQILRAEGLSPLHLECEITEGTLMDNPEQALFMMERLREKGIHLALDDFGTGYSSLAYLKQFPLNTLKIDKAFIDDIALSNEDRQMAAAIINIAHNLGLKVVAEGVEHDEQLTILRRYECEMMQGYLYSKPLSAERFEALLVENQALNKVFKANI